MQSAGPSRPPEETEAGLRRIVGTVKWCSLKSHRGVDLGPRDDLESLAYTLLYLVRGNLPWQKAHGSPYENMKNAMARVRASKVVATGRSLGDTFPVGFADLLDDTRRLGPTDVPPYSDLIARWAHLAESLGSGATKSLDWTPLDPVACEPVIINSTLDADLESQDESDPDEADDRSDSNESFSDSYFGLDIADWELHGGRDKDLTLPPDLADMLDRGMAHLHDVHDPWQC